MDGATIHQRINAGRGKAALRIGLDCALYRPLSAAAPLGNQIGTIKAAFNSGDSSYRAPNLYGDPVWYVDLDGSMTRPGDYLVRASDGATWFIAAQQQMLPIVAIDCARAVRFARQSATPGAVGLQGYGSTSPCDPLSMADILGSSAAGAVVMWPCSILLGGRSQAALAQLPTSAKQAGWRIVLPPSVPVVIQSGDIATDDLGRRYMVEAAELSDMGWRINAQEVHA